MKQSILALFIALLCLPASAADFVTSGPARRFLETDVHLLAGGSYVTNNYASSFPEIADVNSSMRGAWGLGLGARFGLTGFISLGTELNLTFNSGRMDLAVSSPGTSTASTVFLNNKYRYLDIPVFMRFNFTLAHSVIWTVDGGFYWAYGVGGSQKSTIINSSINGLGQLTTTTEKAKCGYFANSQAFINSFRRNDLGLHLATGLTFSSKIAVGIRMHYGFKNAADTHGLVRPSCHNLNVFGTLGYLF